MRVKASRKNERIKLLVSYLNGMALALMALGVVGPLAYHIADQAVMPLDLAVAYAIFSLIVHLVAQWLLGELEVE